MFNNKTILRHDIFSWTVINKYWMSHEWLFEIIIYVLKIIFGKYNILVYSCVFIFFLLLLLFLSNKEGFLKNIYFSMIWISFSMILIGFIQCRPHLVSYILLAITIFILYDLYYNEDSKKIYILPFISLIWVNIHGGSSNLSYILPLFFLISGLFNFNFKKIESKKNSKRQIKKLFLIIVISLIIICINPHGINMLFYPYQNMNDAFMLNSIEEWHPTNLSDFTHLPYFMLVVFIIFIYLLSVKKIRFIDFLLFGFAVFLGFKSIRFWPFTYIIATYNIFYYIKERKQAKGTYLVLVFFAFMLLLLSVFNINKLDTSLNYKVLSDKTINYLKANVPKRLFNYYDYGGYLIDNDIMVFIDGRADLYSKYNYKDYYCIVTLCVDYNNLIDNYNFDYFLIPKNIGLYTFLKDNNNYNIVLDDSESVIFEKNIK